MDNNRTDADRTRDVLRGTVAELRTLGVLVGNWDTVAEYADELRNGSGDPDTLRDYANAAAAAVGGAGRLADVLVLRDEYDEVDAVEWVDAWVDSALDVEVRGRLVAGRWEVTEVALLVSYGGPTTRIVWDGGTEVRVVVSWWSDTAETVVECEALAAHLEAFADAVVAV